VTSAGGEVNPSVFSYQTEEILVRQEKFLLGKKGLLLILSSSCKHFTFQEGSVRKILISCIY
jgi:hypothetical protein